MTSTFPFKKMYRILFCIFSAVLFCFSLYVLINLEISYKYEVEEYLILGDKILPPPSIQDVKKYLEAAIILCKTLLGYIVLAMVYCLIDKRGRTAPQ